MIKKFSVLYDGHVDIEDPGLEGRGGDDRLYSNEDFASVFDRAKDLAQHMEDLGLYCLWMAEHHFQREGYECIPNLIHLGTWLATQTKRIKFGCAFNIVPMWHPLRLAEDYAMADILSDGRIIFGVGRGYHTREVETFGAPLIDNDANRELFEEQVEVIQKAFNEDSFSHEGKYYTIPAPVDYRGYKLKDVTLVPRPKHRPVEIWQPIGSGRTLDYIARMGFKTMTHLTGERALDLSMRQFQEIASRHGRELELGEDITPGFDFYLSDDPEEAYQAMEPLHDEVFKQAVPFGFMRYMDEEGRMWGTPGAPSRSPTLEDSIEQKAWFAGTPDQLTDFLRTWEEKWPGMEHVMLHWPYGLSLEGFKEQLSIFASEVMPHFNGHR